MFSWFTSRKTERQKAHLLYGAVVAQARDPLFFSDFRVPDTAEGRYEMIVLHVVLMLERLKKDGAAGQALARALVEAFVEDMDDSMRELGVGDLTVPKKVKKAAAGLYERSGLYSEALAASGNASLIDALSASIPEAAQRPDAGELADYVRHAAAALDGWRASGPDAGEIAFPRPGLKGRSTDRSNGQRHNIT